MAEPLILIGALASRAGVSTQTIRFYEREGLLPRPKRSPNGYRVYPVAVIAEIQFIRECLAAGFTLREIKPLLTIQSRAGRGQCVKVAASLRDKIQRLDAQMEALRAARESLSRLLAECGASSGAEDCGALEILREGGRKRKAVTPLKPKR